MYQKYIYGLLFSACLVFLATMPSCLKDDEEEVKAEELKLLQQYLTSNNITVIPTSSGLYYIEISPGSGLYPKSTDWIEVSYTVRLVSSNEVVMTSDSVVASDNAILNKYTLYGPNRVLMSSISIRGLHEGLSMMKEGGKATLIFPSSLGYGNIPYGSIPAYSSLIFDVELHRVISNISVYERANMNAYLTANQILLGDSTASGLYYIETLTGKGETPKVGNIVEIIYRGSYLNGKVFDEVFSDNTYSFIVGYNQVIAGLDEGIRFMREGGKAKMVIPYYLAYGKEGYNHTYYGTLVWPYTTLVFEVGLSDIK